MDPNVAWQHLLDALVGQTWETAADAAEALLGWLKQGGFPPQLFPDRPLKEAWNRALARLMCELVLAEVRDRLRRDCCS